MTPIAFGDKDGWPAMGTFDYINMRANGYDFHEQLMAGEAAWDGHRGQDRVRDLARAAAVPQAEGSLGRTWQDAAQTLEQGLGDVRALVPSSASSSRGEATRGSRLLRRSRRSTPSTAQDAVEAPIDGFMLSKDPKNEAAGKALLEYLAGPEAQNTYLKSDPNNVAANNEADTSNYNAHPEQGERADLRGQADLAVPRPRHAARLRLAR